MDHLEAERQMLSERYLLNELTPEVREEFEEHFFSCQQCALDLETGAAFLDHSKAVLSSPMRSEVTKPVELGPQKFWTRLRPAFVFPCWGC
jgi:anti-sigma factor RsiW